MSLKKIEKPFFSKAFPRCVATFPDPIIVMFFNKKVSFNRITKVRINAVNSYLDDKYYTWKGSGLNLTPSAHTGNEV